MTRRKRLTRFVDDEDGGRVRHRRYIEDGFDMQVLERCPECGAKMQVVRLGDARCSAECYIVDELAVNRESDGGVGG